MSLLFLHSVIFGGRDVLKHSMKYIIFHTSKINNDENGTLLKIHYPITKIYSELFNCPEKNIPNTDLEFYNGAQFIVSINTILSNDIEFYKKMIRHVSKDVRPRAGFVFERLWSLVFKSDTL